MEEREISEEEKEKKSKFIIKIYDEIGKYCPRSWRAGQSIFNTVDILFGVARDVQFLDGVDCFYDDKQISKFLDCAWERYKIKQKK